MTYLAHALVSVFGALDSAGPDFLLSTIQDLGKSHSRDFAADMAIDAIQNEVDARISICIDAQTLEKLNDCQLAIRNYFD